MKKLKTKRGRPRKRLALGGVKVPLGETEPALARSFNAAITALVTGAPTLESVKGPAFRYMDSLKAGGPKLGFRVEVYKL